MTKNEKLEIVENLYNELSSSSCFYLTNFEGLSVNLINNFRRKCFEKEIKYKVVKNTLLKKILERLGKSENTNSDNITDYTKFADSALKGASGLLILDKISGIPANLIKSYRKEIDSELPIFKGACIDGEFYLGESSLATLANLKSKEELIGDILHLLQSPINNVLSALDSGKNTLAGIMDVLSGLSKS